MSAFFRRILSGSGFYVAALLALGSCLYAAIGVLQVIGLSYYTKGDVIYFLVLPRGDVIHLLLPLIAALPAATLCAQDRAHGYMIFVLHRCGRRRYIVRRLLQAALGAAMAMALGLLLYFLLVYTCSPYMPEGTRGLVYDSYAPLMAAHALPLAWDTLWRMALAAASWALVCAGLSVFLSDVQAVLAVIVVYYFVSQLLVGSALNDWMPQRVQMPDIFTHSPLWHYTLRQLVHFFMALAFSWMCLHVALRKQGVLRA